MCILHTSRSRPKRRALAESKNQNLKVLIFALQRVLKTHIFVFKISLEFQEALEASVHQTQ